MRGAAPAQILLVVLTAVNCAHSTPQQPNREPTTAAAPAPAQSSSPSSNSADSPNAVSRSSEPASGLLALDFGGTRHAVYYEPTSSRARDHVTVMLHGMCALPEYECPVYRSGATAAGWLLCPPGPVACTGSGAMWTGTEPQLRSVIESSLQALDERQAGAGAGRRALVGYSLGASAALRIAYSGRPRFDALMLVNAGLDPDAKRLTAAGILRVALVAGSRDQSAARLARNARRLARANVDARYFELAGTGHFFDAQSEQRMVEPLRWLLEK